MRRLLVVIASIAMLASSAAPALAQDTSGLSATPLTPDEVIHANRSLTGRIAQSDAELLKRTDNRLVNVMIKFDLDPVASYRGGVGQLKATSPQTTGKSLKKNKAAVAAYEKYLTQQSTSIRQAIKSKVPAVKFGATYLTAYGGVAAQLPAKRAKQLLNVDGVAAVQLDRLEQPLTDVTPTFVGAEQAWPSLGGSTKAGEGVIVGVLDTGIWPEHPSFADPGISHPGGSYGCEFGDGSDPELGDPFNCNDKLIGAYAFVDTYLQFGPDLLDEFCKADRSECSARDANGHGTHTSGTAAGGPVEEAVLLGVDRGPISGMAPGAHVIMYRVCLDAGCFQSDSVAAVNQAISDGADVLNFSISGGSNAYTDPVELAFLDAYAAGILANASAGNSGPGAGTSNHAGPWTNTVGASTSDRHFFSTLELTADGDASLAIAGVTVTDGVAPTPVIRAGDIAGYADELCLTPLPPGSATGMVVACERGVIARVDKSFNVMQGDGEGMILYNPILQGLNSDNHWIPSIHIEGPPTDFLDFLTTNTGVMATWVTGTATPVQGDVMASFSSRGPVGDFLKPDVTAPGVQILAGNSPAAVGEGAGLPGQLFQAIAGTSMSSPHSAGVAALVKAANPGWTPGQIKSALMTSSVQDVLKEDGSTASDPFDRGAGSIRANRAVGPTVTFDVHPAAYFASATDPSNRIHLNLPSVHAPEMPGAITTSRTARNVTGTQQRLNISTTAPAGASITVSPSSIVLGPGQAKSFDITIDGTALADGQYFGEIRLSSTKAGFIDAILPVAFNKQPGTVTLDHTCADDVIDVGSSAACEVSVANFAPVPANVSLAVEGPRGDDLTVENFSDGKKRGNGFRWSGTLAAAAAPTIESIAPPGPPFGYLPLSGFGITPIGGVGDETIVNFTVNPFLYGSETYTTIGIVSNGYAVVGGGTATDVSFIPQTFPNPARPNNVLAPFWTDLDVSAGGALRVAQLATATQRWLVLDWEDVPTWESDGEVINSFQIWIQNLPTGTESITYVYGPIDGPDSIGLTVGAENRDGSSGVNLGAVPSEGDGYTITTSPPVAGGTKTITYDAVGNVAGTYDVLARMTSNVTAGTARKVVTIAVE